MSDTVEMLRDSLRKCIDSRHFVPACLAAGIILRLLWITLVHGDQVADFGVYLQRAISIANGQGYSANGIPTAYAPIGYPGFLGVLFYLFGPFVLVGQLVNVILSTGIMFLGYFVSKQIFGSERAARIALCILAFYPNQIAYNGMLSAEIPFTFLILLGAVFFLSAQGRSGFLLLSGVSWGMAALTKSQGLVIPVLFLLLCFTSLRSFFKACALIGATMVLILSPWILRNYFVMGIPAFDTHGGIVLFEGNNPYANGRGFWDSHVQALLGDLAADDAHMFDGKEVARNARAHALAVDYIVHNPKQVIMLWPKKLMVLYLADVDGIFYTLGIEVAQAPRKLLQTLYLGLRIVGELYYVFIILLCLIALPTVLRSNIPVYYLGLGILMYFTIVSVVFLGDPRYHFSFMPWATMYAGIGAELMLQPDKSSVLSPAHDTMPLIS